MVEGHPDPRHRASDDSPAAFGGAGWSPRRTTLREELGTLWTACGLDAEWTRLEAVLLHRPGPELAVADPGAALMLARPDPVRAAAEHDALAAAYAAEGIDVAYVEPDTERPPPNLLFVADLLFMTPEGAVVARPASTVRAGEERWVARRLAALGIPIVRSVRGAGVFEGADAAWLTPGAALVGTGLRTNEAGAAQLAATLREMDVDVVRTTVPAASMHLMGQLRFLDRDLAVIHGGRIDGAALAALRDHGYAVHAVPDTAEADEGFALNIVTLGPRRILMPAGRPVTQAFYEGLGVACVTVAVDGLLVAAGGIGCLTGVLRRASAH